MLIGAAFYRSAPRVAKIESSPPSDIFILIFRISEVKLFKSQAKMFESGDDSIYPPRVVAARQVLVLV